MIKLTSKWIIETNSLEKDLKRIIEEKEILIHQIEKLTLKNDSFKK